MIEAGPGPCPREQKVVRCNLFLCSCCVITGTTKVFAEMMFDQPANFFHLGTWISFRVDWIVATVAAVSRQWLGCELCAESDAEVQIWSVSEPVKKPSGGHGCCLEV